MIAVIDYDVGNVGSIANMLKKAGAEAEITADPERIERADKVVLAGVGSFDTGMQKLRQRGMVDLLNRKVRDGGTPLLGICLGMQFFGRGSEEGSEPGLGWLRAETVRFKLPPESRLKIPHMGWNALDLAPAVNGSHGIAADARFYFVHSYHLVCEDESDVFARTTYGYPFVSAVRRGNIFGVQFHPEKSHRFGLALMERFASS
ncbi:MAG: imidazole glycerol phosphate synthase subunit HisH [Vicinamibacterales bacterium]